mmetsp:Transcript_2321/g.3451  ORF Transcript_2321/g.3451 Transcript_2321/m.3451 type:complete len:328 (+) Transcript_2321:198-1181(+)
MFRKGKLSHNRNRNRATTLALMAITFLFFGSIMLMGDIAWNLISGNLSKPRSSVRVLQMKHKPLCMPPRRLTIQASHTDNCETGSFERIKYSIFGQSEAVFPEGWKQQAAKVQYSDSIIDRHLLGVFMDRMSTATKTSIRGPVNYENFVRLCFDSIKGKNATAQTQQSLDVMQSFLPPGGEKAFHFLFPKGKASYEINAKITEIGFSWLVGPIAIDTTSENDIGIPMKTSVKIKKCRWLQESACTGMCVNLCKRPTQQFFLETFGLPLTIKPNFEDKSCEFCFGQTPPPQEEDPAYKFPCHVSCESGRIDENGDKPCYKLPSSHKLE